LRRILILGCSVLFLLVNGFMKENQMPDPSVSRDELDKFEKEYESLKCLFIKKMRDELTPEDAEELEKWASKDPRNREWLESWDNWELVESRMRLFRQCNIPHLWEKVQKRAFKTETINLQYSSALSETEFMKIFIAFDSMRKVVIGRGKRQVVVKGKLVKRAIETTKLKLSENGGLEVEFTHPLALQMVAIVSSQIILSLDPSSDSEISVDSSDNIAVTSDQS